MRRSRLFASLAAILCTSMAVAHVRLHNPGNGNPLFWPVPSAVSIVINSTGSDNLSDGSHETSIRSAIRSWNDTTGTSLQLIEDASAGSQARTDWESTGVHLVYFDESNASSFFPFGSGIVAITPVWFFSNGSISDADILFNGSQFSFTTDASSSSMDVEDVVAHELGHMLGLDHSGVVGSTMYPFVSGNVTAHRSLSSDDMGGLRDAYPSGTHASLTGSILRLSDSSGVAGAWVVARDSTGRVAGSALANANGAFNIRGLGAETYAVYATPLDNPVSAGNITPGHSIVTNFEPAIYGTSATVGATSTLALGNLFVDADVSLNLGVAGDALPLIAIADGVPRAHILRGTSLVIGSTLSVSEPTLTIGTTTYFTSQVQFQLTVPINTPPGLVDVQVIRSGTGDLAILPGAIEIVPPSPTVTGISPSTGQAGGGTAVTITGTNFRAGARVVLGDQLYVDGDVGGATVVNSTTITLTTTSTTMGTHDVVVLDETGVEGRMASSFQVQLIPLITARFPTIGSSAGGTEVVVSGSNFQSGLTVKVDGVTQNTVTIDSASLLRFNTEAGTPGGPYTLEIENSGGGLATSAFVYIANADPVVQSVTPSTGAAGGGQEIQLIGTGFTATTTVKFGVDASTGTGGVDATSVTFVDSNTLDVVTPAHGGGAVNMLATNATTGQVDVVSAGFTFIAPESGGGGGGCHTEFVGGGPGPSWREALYGMAWLLALGGYLGVRASASRRQLTRAAVRTQ